VQLDKLQAVLRQRSSFEAIDLGFSMVRRWFGPVYRAWFPVVLPIYALVWALLYKHPFWAYFVLWLIIPLFDRAPLFVISRALFGDTPSVAATLKATPRLLVRHLLHSLLVFRLDPARSFFLPVLQLEGGTRRARSRRRTALLRNMGVPSAWLTAVFLSLHIVMLMGFMILLIIMLPDRPEWSLSMLSEQMWNGTAPWWIYVALPVAELLSLSLIEPLYVAGGFALYINRRTQLEGWDIELTFRGLADRLRADGFGRFGQAALLVVVVGLVAALLIAASPNEAQAQPFTSDRPEPVPQTYPSDEPNERGIVNAQPPASKLHPTVDPEGAIKRVLERPEFGKEAKRWVWRRRHPADEDEAHQLGEPPSFLELVGRIVAAGLEGILWVAAALALAGLAFLIISRLRALGPSSKRGRDREPLPEPRAGTYIEDLAKTLPRDVPGAAWSLWEQGRYAESLGLLYRGALAAVGQRYSIVVEENATEGECMGLVRQSTPEQIATFFERVTRTWELVAYAHRNPDGQLVHELCARWPEHFGAPS